MLRRALIGATLLMTATGAEALCLVAADREYRLSGIPTETGWVIAGEMRQPGEEVAPVTGTAVPLADGRLKVIAQHWWYPGQGISQSGVADFFLDPPAFTSGVIRAYGASLAAFAWVLEEHPVTACP
jgi:hypothetical protein